MIFNGYRGIKLREKAVTLWEKNIKSKLDNNSKFDIRIV